MMRPSTSRSVSSTASSRTPRGFDPTGRLRASAKLAGKSIHRMVKNAVKIHEPEEVSHDAVPHMEPFRRTIVRKMEVPFERKVKVAVKTTTLEPAQVRQRVKVKKMVEVPSWREVEERYTVTKERPVEREREVWVKKIVKEVVMEPYEEEHTRKKRVPTTEFKEIEEDQEVMVTVTKPVTRTGYRIDTVQDRKLVEVEEEEIFEMQPKRREHRVVGARELGRAPGKRLARVLGHTTVDPPQSVDSDSDPDDVAVAPRQNGKTRIGFTLRQGNDASAPVVARVEPGGAAEKAGIKPGDLVLNVGATPVSTLHSFRDRVSSSTGPVEFTVVRNGRTMQTTVRRKRR